MDKKFEHMKNIHNVQEHNRQKMHFLQNQANSQFEEENIDEFEIDEYNQIGIPISGQNDKEFIKMVQKKGLMKKDKKFYNDFNEDLDNDNLD